MAKFTDGTMTLEIEMYGINGAEFSNDFFEVRLLMFDEDRKAYVVDDVCHLIKEAVDWENGTGEYYDAAYGDKRYISIERIS